MWWKIEGKTEKGTGKVSAKNAKKTDCHIFNDYNTFSRINRRIMYIEVTSGEKYEKIVLTQQEYDSTILPYQRGDIVDAKGTVLATSVDVYNVILDCKVLNSKEEYLQPTIEAQIFCF